MYCGQTKQFQVANQLSWDLLFRDLGFGLRLAMLWLLLGLRLALIVGSMLWGVVRSDVLKVTMVAILVKV